MAFEGSEEEAQAEELRTQPLASVWPLLLLLVGRTSFLIFLLFYRSQGLDQLSIHQRAQYGLAIWLAYIIFDSGKQC